MNHSLVIGFYNYSESDEEFRKLKDEEERIENEFNNKPFYKKIDFAIEVEPIFGKGKANNRGDIHD